MSKNTPIILKWYQTLSKFTPSACRYYPSCSEYAKWLYENDNFLNATTKSAIRILRCNKFFTGGIDYPTFNYTPPPKLCLKREWIKVKYWFVFNGKNYSILKSFD